MWLLKPNRYVKIERHRVNQNVLDVYGRVNADIYLSLEFTILQPK